MYRYILRESCSQFDSLPLTSLTVKVWDATTTDCLRSFVPGRGAGGLLDTRLGALAASGAAGGGAARDERELAEKGARAEEADTAVHTCRALPRSPGVFLVCTASSSAYVVDLQGKVLERYSAPAIAATALAPAIDAPIFIAATASPRGQWIHCLAENGTMYSFNRDEPTDAPKQLLAHVTKVKKGAEAPTVALATAPLGVMHHPHRNIVASFDGKGAVKLWT